MTFHISHDKDGSHNIQSAISENSMLHANFMAVCFITRIIADQSFTLWEQDFAIFFAPVTLTWIWWPSYTNLTRIHARYTGCKKMNFLCQDFRKLLYYKYTDRQTWLILYTMSLRGWSNSNKARAEITTYWSSASVEALHTAWKTVLCGCICIEAAGQITFSDTLTIAPVVSTRNTFVSTRSPTTTSITELWTTCCKCKHEKWLQLYFEAR